MTKEKEFDELFIEFHKAVNKIELLRDFNFDLMLHEQRTTAQQFILKELKNFCKDGQLAESYLDVLIKGDK